MLFPSTASPPPSLFRNRPPPPRIYRGTHATTSQKSMQGWGHRTYRPSKKHALEKKVNVVSVADKEHQQCALGEYRITLEKDIAKLQKKLKQEVDIHRALERAFRRTLGVLPRFSPFLPPKIRELLAEVAVLEEEVINLEEHIVCLRQGLYSEAAYLLTSKQQKEGTPNSEPLVAKEKVHHLQNGSKGRRNSVIAKLLPPVMENKTDDSYIAAGKSGNDGLQKSANSNLVNEKRNPQIGLGYAIHNGGRPSLNGEVATPRINMSCQIKVMGEQELGLEKEHQQKSSRKLGKLWPQSTNSIQGETTAKFSTLAPKAVSSCLDSEDGLEPNALSEEMVWCLSNVFLKLTKPGILSDCETSSTVSHSTLSSIWSFSSRHSANYKPSMDTTEEMELPDPYGTCIESTPRDIGPYKYYHDITTNSLDYSRIPRSTSLLKRLMVLVDKLSIVDLRGLTHQQKLAFWINIYNVCMMHAFLEHGIPTSPHKVVALMGKAIVNVGGHFLSALAIEHFILRLPSDLENTDWKSRDKDAEKIMRSTYGLEWPEPSVSFALCCGSWSSPAVRVYTPLEIENELEVARNEYLQAAVGVTPTRVIIPKLLDWYMRDFAKDAESLIEWITEQLPSSLSKAVQRCLANKQGQVLSEVVEVMPYDFNFRYLLAVQPF